MWWRMSICAISPLSADSQSLVIKINSSLSLPEWISGAQISLSLSQDKQAWGCAHAVVNDWTVRWITERESLLLNQQHEHRLRNGDSVETACELNPALTHQKASRTSQAFNAIDEEPVTLLRSSSIFIIKSACKTLLKSRVYASRTLDEFIVFLIFSVSWSFRCGFYFSCKCLNVITLDLKLKT